jgi:subtilisin family serine protease
MKILKTIKDVHIRNGSPKRLDTNKKGVIYAGFEIEVIDEVQGESINGNDLWYKDKIGDFYWSGGFEQKDSDTKPPSFGFEKFIDYSLDLQTKITMPPKAGDEILVALLDTGVVSAHPDLADAIIASQSFINDEPINSENTGHGTMMAGFICGHPATSIGIKGVAANSKILDLKVIRNNGTTDVIAVKKALEFILENAEFSPHIINMSLSIPRLSDIQETLDKVIQKGIYVVGAAGESNIFKYNKTSVLAEHPDVIAVGAVSSSYMQLPNPTFPANLDFYFNNVKQWSTFKAPKLYNQDFGDSIYTAIVSGLLARQIASNLAVDHVAALKSLAFKKENFQSDSLKIYNP